MKFMKYRKSLALGHAMDWGGRMSNADPVLLSSTVFSPVRRVRTKCVVSVRKTKGSSTALRCFKC